MRPSVPLLCSAIGFLAAASAQAQGLQPIYKCSERVYSQAPCGSGQPLGAPRVAQQLAPAPVPQDRARRMARAQLPPDVQAQCAGLEAAIRDETARQRRTPPTEQEEGDLAIQRVHYRELRC